MIDAPNGLLPGTSLDFEVTGTGPGSEQLTATFKGEIVVPPPAPEPRHVTTVAPEALSQRRPPYDLRYVKEAEWESPTCWGQNQWTKDDVGSFNEPSATTPLTLLVNEDAACLKEFKETLARRKLDESTVRERVTRYTTHVAFHLYQMYLFVKQRRDEQDRDPQIKAPDDEDMRSEINRVATTLLQLMEVAVR